MVEGRDYYFLLHESKDGNGKYRCHYTAIHHTSWQGTASSDEFKGEWDYGMVKETALNRMKDAVIAHYEKKAGAA